MKRKCISPEVISLVSKKKCITVNRLLGLEMRHPRCVGSITKNFVYHTYSRTQLYIVVFDCTCDTPSSGELCSNIPTFCATIYALVIIFY